MTERIQIFDGPVEEMLSLFGAPPDERILQLRPQLVSRIYREYVEAGTDILSSCTLRANRSGLKPFGLQASAGKLACLGAEIARKSADAAGRKVLVAGNIGQIGGSHLRHGSLVCQYKEQVRGLTDGGADFLHLRGFSRRSVAEAVLEAIDKTGSPLSVMISVELTGGPYLPTIRQFWQAVQDRPLLAFGLCGFHAHGTTELLRQLAAGCNAPLVCCRDAEADLNLEHHREHGDHLARSLMAMAQEGLLNYAGGNRGTMPIHICALRTALDGIRPRQKDIPTC